MKTILISAMLLVAANLNITAQNLIARQHGGNAIFYTDLPTAVAAGQNGDTIYIPGGSWSANLSINKRLFIIGTGHNPDSTQATGICYLSGNISISNGASNGRITGIYLTGTLAAVDTATNYIISRCRMGNIQLTAHSSQWIIEENIINSQIIGYGAYNNLFSNNIIGQCFYNMGPNNTVKNNIFLMQSYEIGCSNSSSVNNCTFENNNFIGGGNFTGQNNNLINNNLFVANITFPFGNNLGSNNVVNQTQSSIFVNQTGSTFDYTQDYHLKLTSPGKNAGTDGTDIGIYGGMFPWKAGSVPFNPHIQIKSISNTTDQNGNLQINIKVNAQNN